MTAFRQPEPPPDVAALLTERDRLAARIRELRVQLHRAQRVRRWKRIGIVVAALVTMELLTILGAKLIVPR
jgi:hypothetical protein